MSSAAFSYKSKPELKQMSMMELNLYIAELRKRAKFLQGPALESLKKYLDEAMKARDQRRKA